MFTADPRIIARLEPTVRRTLIVDPNAHAAKLLVDLVKEMGAREVVVEAEQRRALAAAAEFDPGLVFVEHSGPQLNGEEFSRTLRRSSASSRRAPIIMVTAVATPTSIKGARDSGVHEFLKKPFTSADLFRRVENVALKPRNWVEAVGYVGPDRRRFNSGEYAGPRKRRADGSASNLGATAAQKDQAMRILRSALDQFDTDPMQAVRALRQQAETLKTLAMKASDVKLAVAASGLEAALAAPGATRTTLAAPVSAVTALHLFEAKAA